MIKIAFDTSPLQDGNSTRGMGVYTRNLLTNLKKDPNLVFLEFNQRQLIPQADLVHYPYFELFKHSLPINQKLPTIVTLPDITPLMFSDHYPPGLQGRWNLWLQSWALKNVKQVITLSESSKKDITEHFPISSDRVTAIHLAPAEHFRPIKDRQYLSVVKQKYQLPDHFAVYTGSVNWNKNILGICQACLDAQIDLVLVGQGFEIKQNLNHPELKSHALFLQQYAHQPLIHTLGFIPDEDLVAVLNLAQLMVFPSFYEGFGLPVLEAQACGLPVITSNISSLPEVAGEGAMFVNPADVSAITLAIRKLGTDRALQQSLVQKGFMNVQQFSWAKTAEETKAVYQKAVVK